MKQATITLVLFLTISAAAIAQSTISFEIEIDPLAYAIGGASGHGVLSFEKDRLQIGYAALEVPESFRSNPDIGEEFKAISLKWDHYFGESTRSGFFVGPTLDYLFLTYTNPNGQITDLSRPSAGLRTGYRFDLFSEKSTLGGLYVTPWLGVSYIFENQEVVIENETHALGAVKVFPTVHVGWRF